MKRRIFDVDIIFVDAHRLPQPSDLAVARKDEVMFGTDEEDANDANLETADQGSPVALAAFVNPGRPRRPYGFRL